MRRLTKRIDKLEHATSPRTRLVHIFPGDTEKKAFAAHVRAHGPIPKDAAVIVIRHTFKSRL